MATSGAKTAPLLRGSNGDQRVSVMADSFHFDPAAYRKRVARIAEHVVGSSDAIPTIAPRCVDSSGNLSDGALTTRDEVGRRVTVVTRRQLS